MGKRGKKRREEERQRLQAVSGQDQAGINSSPVIAIEREEVDDDVLKVLGIEEPTTDESATGRELEPIKPESERLFRLNVAPAHGVSAVLQFTWCLTPQALEILRANNVMHPFIVVSAFSYKDDPSGVETLESVDRVLLPLDRAMGQFEFTKPGKFKVCASIVWSPIEDQGRAVAAKNLFDLFMVKDNNKLRYSLTDGRNYRILSLDRDYYLHHHEEIDVNINESFFAKKPDSEWLWWWVNLWHRSPRNQCIWRKRLYFFAFTLKPILALIYILLVLVMRVVAASIMFLFGFRYLSLKPFLHPFAMEAFDLSNSPHEKPFDPRNFFSIAEKDGKKRTLILQIMLMPLMWLPVIGAFFLLNYYFGEAIRTNLEKVMLAFFFWVGVLTALVIVNYLSKGLDDILAKQRMAVAHKGTKETAETELIKLQKAKEAEAKKQAEEAAKNAAREIALRTYYQRRLEPLSCAAGGPRIADLRAVPKTHRTVWMYFDDFVTRVCKPYAQ